MGTSSESKMATSRGLMPRRSSRFVAHLFLTLITLCLFCDILRLGPSASAVPVTHLTHRRDVSDSHDQSLYHGAVDPSEGSKRRNLGDDISNTFHDAVDKVKNVFKPSDDKKMTAVEVVAEYAYDELDHGVGLKKLQESFQKLHDDMEHGNNKTDDGDWIHKQIKDTVPGLKETFEKANKTESEKKKHSAGNSPSSSRGLSLDILDDEPLADSTDREQGSGAMNGGLSGHPNSQDLAGKAFNGAKQIFQGQTGRGNVMANAGSHGYTDPSNLAGQGVNGFNQVPQGQVGHGIDGTGSGSTGYTESGSQAGQGNGLTSTDPTIQQGQGNGMAETGSTGETNAESHNEAAPVAPQAQSPGVLSSDAPATGNEGPLAQSEGDMTGATESLNPTGDASANTQTQGSGNNEPQASNGNAGVDATHGSLGKQTGDDSALGNPATHGSQVPNVNGAGNNVTVKPRNLIMPELCKVQTVTIGSAPSPTPVVPAVEGGKHAFNMTKLIDVIGDTAVGHGPVIGA